MDKLDRTMRDAMVQSRRKETAMRHKSAAVVFVLVMAVAIMQSQTSGKTATAANIEPVTGKQLFNSYCALCHGTDAKGGGPFATQLKVWPPDLTQLAKKNHGEYPSMHVQEAIDGEFAKGSHGTAEMPIWGPVFRSMAHGKKDSAQLRINSLVKYIESLQEK
jgi:mono/diheme cytochrome c family protein